ncbi:MAG: pyruvate, phosphate dikinase [Alphaproteobacteria bacterium]|uniref:Phosphoenolpyruvate synthase n=1 Tax=Candidatus Nitrobium versatile TaxID=2884831 RepID=A0A953J7R3_9BACT|nr:pyruvate, phosphate dikinase [Candidatus Nitrobium versatile]
MPLTNVQGVHVKKYRFFKSFLSHNHAALKTMAEMEQLYYGGRPFAPESVRIKYEELLEAVVGAVSSLEGLARREFPRLRDTLSEIDHAVSGDISPVYEPGERILALPFGQVTPSARKLVGAKATNLAFIRNELHLPAPDGFAVTAYAFERFMEENHLWEAVERVFCRNARETSGYAEEASTEIQRLIMNAPVPESLERAILDAYASLERRSGTGIPVAMRSSAVGEDTEATFAGQYTTVLNVTAGDILRAYKEVVAGKYSARAVSYRLQYGLDDKETPMCVAAVAMIDPRSSGVMYTKSGTSGMIEINSLWGLGESLVDGSTSPDSFVVDKNTKAIIGKEIRRKEYRLVMTPEGGTKREKVQSPEKDLPSLDDASVTTLAHYGLLLEDSFGGPQDVEWALDKEGSLFLLQSRPLSLPEAPPHENAGNTKPAALPDHPVLLSAGKTASPGIATGHLFIILEGTDMNDVPGNCILVAKTASPDYARLAGRIRGIITDQGSVTSHLASVAREFGIPAIVETGNATSLLPEGEVVTLAASDAIVYRGAVEELAKESRAVKRPLFESPVHRRMGRILDRISPLNLTDPSHPCFAPEGCKTVHDIIRFTHERAMQEMFDLTEEAEEVRSVRLTAALPLVFHLIELGGGLRSGLTTCTVVTPDDIESIPLKALWKGFTHPGINWEGTVNFDAKNIMTLFAASATSEFGEPPGGVSYAIISREYMNLSAKFGYHFATIDALCSDDSNQNYLSLQFSGGAGNYYGKLLRIYFLGSVLRKLGFLVSEKGDLMEGSLVGYNRKSMEEKLDLLGRLLASSRLLDMSLSDQHDIEVLTNSFFSEEYDFLSGKRENQLTGFYTHGGYWKVASEDDHVYCIQDGSRSGFTLSAGVAGLMGKLVGQALQDFLDTIEAYYYFPLAIAKYIEIEEGSISVKVKPVGGHIDRAGGIAFGIQDAGNYFVLRINALENNIILFEYKNNNRVQRASAQQSIASGIWHHLTVKIRERRIKGYLNGQLLIEHAAEKAVKGFIGLWTKADSTTYFDEFTVTTGERKEVIEF